MTSEKTLSVQPIFAIFAKNGKNGLVGWLVGWFSPLDAILHLFLFKHLSSPSQIPVDSDAQMWPATELSVPLTSRKPGAAPASSGSSHPSLRHWKAPRGAWAGEGQQSAVWQAQGSTQSLSQLLHPGRSTGCPPRHNVCLGE